MAIRKPTAPTAKSAFFGDFLAGQAAVKEFKSGSIIEGTVSAVKGSDVFVDIGYKSEGTVDLAEFGDAEVKPGLTFQVKLIDLEDDKTGMVRLSKRAADEQIRWQQVLERYTEGCVVTGTIRTKVNGGLIVDIDGVEAFLPGSQVDVSVGRDRDRDLTPYIGQTYDFKVIKISNERKNIIVSRRELIQAANDEKKEALLASLQKDEVREGTVKNITDFGAFIDLDGIDGLLHITDMSWGRIKHPSELLKVGDKINVKVLDVDREKERISLGLKQTMPNPWDTIAEQFPVDARVTGKVVNLAPSGAFVEIAPGIEGLVHISEFSWTKRISKPEEMLKQGDEVQVQVLSVDPETQKIALGIRQTMENPWDTAQDRYPVGSRQTGTVRNFTAYGAFVQLEDSIDGMIHISDMSWTRKITRPEECLKKGQKVETIVLDVDAKQRRISLGLKQAQTDPWTEIVSKYQVGSLVKGKVSKIASFGAFIELEDGVDGLVHISQISDQRIEKVRDVLKEGDEVEARVVKVDRGERRIGLSIRAVNMTEDEIKALEAESVETETAPASTTTQGSEQLGSLGAAFDALSVEWQPGEDK
ncbi:MAG: 30S ribosomal protein S1 [Kiritimatiellae bacterium]|nr:30S ribosomal protein S1 [Kiritimatiellia bacterium]